MELCTLCSKEAIATVGVAQRKDKVIPEHIQELMTKCFDVSLRVAYIDSNYTIERDRPNDVPDYLWKEVWEWVKGDYQEKFIDRMNGRCFPDEALKFSLKTEEKYMRGYLSKILFLPKH